MCKIQVTWRGTYVKIFALIITYFSYLKKMAEMDHAIRVHIFSFVDVKVKIFLFRLFFFFYWV